MLKRWNFLKTGFYEGINQESPRSQYQPIPIPLKQVSMGTQNPPPANSTAKAPGKILGRRRSLTDDQVQLARGMKGAGASGRKIAQVLEVDEKTVRNVLKAAVPNPGQRRGRRGE